MNPLATIFIDTNIFLHFNFFDEIKWEEVVNSNNVKIIIAPIVIAELDKHKYNSNPKIAQRAKKVLQKLESYNDENNDGYQLSNSTQIFILHKRPEKSLLDSHSLQASDQDDNLLASILDYKAHNFKELVYFITNDTGPRLKAKSLNIDICKIPESYLTPNEVDPLEKKLKTLSEENHQLKNKIPKLKIGFDDKRELKRFKIEPSQEIDIKEFMSKEISILDENYPELTNIESDSVTNSRVTDKDASAVGNNFIEFSKVIKQAHALTPQQIEDYNKALSEFKFRYIEYLRELYDYKHKKALTIELELFIFNEGTVPADDLDIYFHFPDGFELTNSTSFIKEPIKPLPPYKPKSRLDFQPMGMSFRLKDLSIPNNISAFQSSGPSIKKTNSYDVDYFVRSIKHNQSHQLDSLLLTFDSLDTASNFRIDYKIMAANIPNEVTGNVNVIIQK